MHLQEARCPGKSCPRKASHKSTQPYPCPCCSLCIVDLGGFPSQVRLLCSYSTEGTCPVLPSMLHLAGPGSLLLVTTQWHLLRPLQHLQCLLFPAYFSTDLHCGGESRLQNGAFFCSLTAVRRSDRNGADGYKTKTSLLSVFFWQNRPSSASDQAPLLSLKSRLVNNPVSVRPVQRDRWLWWWPGELSPHDYQAPTGDRRASTPASRRLRWVFQMESGGEIKSKPPKQ